MHKTLLTWRMMPMLLIIVFVSAGCYRQIGDEIQPTLVSQGLPTSTNTPQPTATDTPTMMPTLSVEETEELVSADALDVVIADASTSTPTFQPTAVAQNNQPSDPFVLTATVLVQEITQTAEFSITQTAQALGIGTTPTPIPTFTPNVIVTQPFATQTPGNTFVGGTCVHEVQAGENLFRLSLRYGVSISDLASASGITNIQLITIGQRITIPGCGTTGVLPPPTSIPTTTAFNAASVPVGATPAPGFNAQAGTTTTTNTGISRTHIVQQYETLFEISLQYGIAMQSIANANGISNPSMIIIGQELLIPAQ
jgi:LysM repeat protein